MCGKDKILQGFGEERTLMAYYNPGNFSHGVGFQVFSDGAPPILKIPVDRDVLVTKVQMNCVNINPGSASCNINWNAEIYGLVENSNPFTLKINPFLELVFPAPDWNNLIVPTPNDYWFYLSNWMPKIELNMRCKGIAFNFFSGDFQGLSAGTAQIRASVLISYREID